jgi:hypothetical protein
MALFQGSIVSAIGYGINSIISAIATVLETIIGAIVAVRTVVDRSSYHLNLLSQVIVAIFDVITDILCCRCCGRRRSSARTGGRRYYRRRGMRTAY